ncbi:MAG: bifunctional phosphopantothenoylcysteine decarboxylase/phosphopantothenate--cysteine ligase CoaBC [Betaproteobacteria bacterium]|jgi:phosphopantothenoylcysteine decarboxylase/phosphopantothenate--cysteine ligase|nr:bifunctional phosphopantothenoylcysteine decarboxylase/phosphopantothenate--cysteine ligase CoaBC [Betaproteobacteria bacterium]
MTPSRVDRLLLGITGGIAAYKTAELVRLLVGQGNEVDVVMTEAARQFVTPVTLQAVSGRPVWHDAWDPRVPNNMAHIELSRDKGLVLIAPASADFIAKLANGLCDDLLSTLCLARDCPLAVVPAMNRQMWENPATQRNVARLLDDGIEVWGPAAGDQACGEVGMGRMIEPAQIAGRVVRAFTPKTLNGLRVLITAGPTFERIDAVRAITNLSSGKMGYAIARAAWEAGAEVTLVSGPTSLAPPPVARFAQVSSAQEMLATVNAFVPDADIFVSVAAVADYHVLNPSDQKIKKDAHILTLELAPNPDILASVSALADPPFCVGFAAESENLDEFAEAKRRRKNLPLLAANFVQTAFGADDNELVLFDDEGRHPLPRAPKLEQARMLIAHISKLYQPR